MFGVGGEGGEEALTLLSNAPDRMPWAGSTEGSHITQQLPPKLHLLQPLEEEEK